MIRPGVLSALVLPALLAAPLRADVIVVDPHGGPGAALLQSALDTAQDGDILVLHPGDYASPEAFDIGSTSLTLVAEPAGSVTLPRLETGLSHPTHPARVVLRGLRLVAPPATEFAAGSFMGSELMW